MNEGQEGAGTLLYNGSNAAEIDDPPPNRSRVRFTRKIASIIMDLDGIEVTVHQ